MEKNDGDGGGLGKQMLTKNDEEKVSGHIMSDFKRLKTCVLKKSPLIQRRAKKNNEV